jgi:hypothetical protein
MIHRGHHAPVERQFRMPGSLLESTGGSVLESADAYGISKRALQEWEQGGRQPDSAARAYLTVIAREPAVVRRALASESA